MKSFETLLEAHSHLNNTIELTNKESIAYYESPEKFVQLFSGSEVGEFKKRVERGTNIPGFRLDWLEGAFVVYDVDMTEFTFLQSHSDYDVNVFALKVRNKSEVSI